MKLTKQTNYAFRMLMFCAVNDDKLSSIPEIAKACVISESYLFKIQQLLAAGGLVETVRGRNGGVRLNRPSSEISLFDVVKITEENFNLAECFNTGSSDCPLIDSCKLNAALRSALNAFFDVLEKQTIEDLVKNNRYSFGLGKVSA